MLYETALYVQQTDFENEEKCQATVNKVEAVIGAFESHAEHEDNFFLPLIEKSNPDLFQSFASEHQKDHELGEQLKAAISAIKIARTDQERKQAGDELFYSFNDFVAFNLYHMNKEEISLNQEIWANYSDEEIMQVHQQIVRSNTPTQSQEAAFWMIKGCSNKEIVQFLQGARKQAPEPVFRNLTEMAGQELPPHRINAINQGLTELI
jgi:hypothetical protein